MNENPETKNRVPVADLAVDALFGSLLRDFEIAKSNHEITLADLTREAKEAGDLRLEIERLRAALQECTLFAAMAEPTTRTGKADQKKALAAALDLLPNS